jgi:hypothetical protein
MDNEQKLFLDDCRVLKEQLSNVESGVQTLIDNCRELMPSNFSAKGEWADLDSLTVFQKLKQLQVRIEELNALMYYGVWRDLFLLQEQACPSSRKVVGNNLISTSFIEGRLTTDRTPESDYDPIPF